MNQYRTHTCGELREEYVGETVKLSGWVDTIRDHGGVTFIDIRDQYGVTQIVTHDEEAVKIGKESVITVSGTVKKRDAETINAKIETGMVEVHADTLVIQSKAVPVHVMRTYRPKGGFILYFDAGWKCVVNFTNRPFKGKEPPVRTELGTWSRYGL
jgi:aspartyl-tRNA synthetase